MLVRNNTTCPHCGKVSIISFISFSSSLESSDGSVPVRVYHPGCGKQITAIYELRLLWEIMAKGECLALGRSEDEIEELNVKRFPLHLVRLSLLRMIKDFAHKGEVFTPAGGFTNIGALPSENHWFSLIAASVYQAARVNPHHFFPSVSRQTILRCLTWQ